jgi:hypothetical protein
MRRITFGIAGTLLCLVPTLARADGDVSPPPERHHTTAPWIVAGVGAAVAVVGVMSFVGAIKAHDDVASESAAKGCTVGATVTCPAGVDATNLQTNLDGERAMNVLGAIFTAVGGAALVGGLVWHFLEPTGPARAGLVVTPALGAGYAGLGLAMRF